MKDFYEPIKIKCVKCNEGVNLTKATAVFKDVINFDGHLINVYEVTCPKCGYKNIYFDNSSTTLETNHKRSVLNE